MSYKAFEALKAHMEIEQIKAMTPEQINEVLVRQNEQIRAARAAYVKLTNCEQYGEDEEVKGRLCPNELLQEFDEALDS